VAKARIQVHDDESLLHVADADDSLVGLNVIGGKVLTPLGGLSLKSPPFGILVLAFRLLANITIWVRRNMQSKMLRGRSLPPQTIMVFRGKRLILRVGKFAVGVEGILVLFGGIGRGLRLARR